jgi:hypothetical protein
MKIVKSKLRKSAVIPIENMCEDLGYPRIWEQKLIVKLWKEKFLDKFFKDNPTVDDLLLFSFDGGSKRILKWIASKETKYNEFIEESCEMIKQKQKWLNECMKDLRKNEKK